MFAFARGGVRVGQQHFELHVVIYVNRIVNSDAQNVKRVGLYMFSQTCSSTEAITRLRI